MTIEQLNFGFHLEPRPEIRQHQVVDLSEIRVGDEYTAVKKAGTKRMKVLSLPHKREDLPNVPGLFIDVEVDTSLMQAQNPGIPLKQNVKISLADFGVIPYEAGNWNTVNHLLRYSGI